MTKTLRVFGLVLFVAVMLGCADVGDRHGPVMVPVPVEPKRFVLIERGSHFFLFRDRQVDRCFIVGIGAYRSTGVSLLEWPCDQETTEP